jgi:hypothetical protein
VLEYHDDVSNTNVRDIAQISMRYLKSDFASDFVPLIPFNWIGIFRFQNCRVFFLIKCYRLKETFDLLDTAKIMKHVKRFYGNKLNKVVEDPELAENIDIDQNKIMTIILVSYMFKILRLIILIILVSYFLGIVFYIICDITRGFESVEASGDDFITKFGFLEQTNLEKAIRVTYFAFTSLSTVGFGDLHPRSDYERLLTAFILLFGVAIFSYVMGNFIEILDQSKTIGRGFDDGDNLSKFFGLIKQFNKGQDIDIKMKERIEDYFDYRWENDHNQAISEPEDYALLEQLPSEI